MIARRKYLILSLISAILIGVLFPVLNYTGKEGFNPSDDGVILAQSWRILNNEVPHRDFIAMKPALSGVLHTIHFYSPLPLEDSARWFVVFQNFIISFLWVFLFIGVFSSVFRKTGWIFISVALITFTLNLNHHGLFPWTTVDGLFWSVIAFAFFISQYEENGSIWRRSFMAALGIFFMSLAFLSRQTFFFLLIFLDLLVMVRYFKYKKYLLLTAILLIGQLPIIIYLIYLFKNDALALFFHQMAGRRELIQVGFLHFIKSFFKSRMLLVNGVIFLYLFWFLYIKFKNRSQSNASAETILYKKYPNGVSFFAFLWMLLCLSFSVNMLVIYDPMNQANPFELFFLMLSILVFTLITAPLDLKQKLLLTMGLILCWTSSLSLGSNSPVYCLGIVVSITIVLSFYLLSITKSELSQIIFHKSYIVMFPVSILIFILGIWMQSRINYRDRPSSELKCKMGKLIPAMGSTRINDNLCSYYTEFLKIYTSIPAMKDHFLLLPNNAMIYPALKSRNPFPVDWLQHDEYIGQETRVLDKMKQVLQEENIYILIDRYNVESIAYSLFAVDYLNLSAKPENDLFMKTYRVSKYDYMPLITKYCTEIPANYSFFHLFVTNKSGYSKAKAESPYNRP
jgi:hypothetical protein